MLLAAPPSLLKTCPGQVWKLATRVAVTVAGITYIYLHGIVFGTTPCKTTVFPEDGVLHYLFPHTGVITSSMAFGVVVSIWGCRPSAWLQKYVFVVTAVYYLNSGVSKLTHGAAWDWLSGAYLQQLFSDLIERYNIPSWLLAPASWAALAFETCMPVWLLISHRGSMVRPLIIICALDFHFGISATIGHCFQIQLWFIVLLVPISAITGVGEQDEQDNAEIGHVSSIPDDKPAVDLTHIVQAIIGTGVALLWLAQCGRKTDMHWPVSSMALYSYPKSHPGYPW